MELIIQKIKVQYDGYEQIYWVIFERGCIDKPICILTDLMAKRFFESYQQQAKAKKK